MPATLQWCSVIVLCATERGRGGVGWGGYESAPYISNVFSRVLQQPSSSLTAVQDGEQTQPEVPYNSQPIAATEAPRLGLLLRFLFSRSASNKV